MSNPSFSNIDLWLFELAEGNLSPEQVEQLEMFLLNHPELDVDRDVWEMAKVDNTPIEYPDAASLERKRRPLVAYGFAGLFLLLLIGSGSYMAWNAQPDDFSEEDVVAQNEQVKAQLFDQVRALQNRNARHTAYTNVNLSNFEAFQKLTLNRLEELSTQNELETVSTFDSSRNSGTQTNYLSPNSPLVASNIANGSNNGLRSENQLTPQDFELVHSTAAQMTNSSESVTNSQDLGYDSALNDRVGNTDKVGDKDFYVREPSEIDVREGRVWTERKSMWSNNSTAATSSEKYRRSFKDRFNQFSRSIERMMNSPIALKNSRDPHYLVPGMTANDVNFSSAGTLISTRVQATSRLQWQGQENEQLMNQISADGYSYGIRGGWGVQLNHQWYNNGGIQVGQVAFTYSPKISVSNWFSVEPSVRMKMGNKRLNAGLMQSTDAVELERGNTRDFYADGSKPIGRSLWYKDLGVGLLVNTKWFFAGVQADNLFRYKDNLYDNNWSDPRRAESHFTATLGTDWISRDKKMSLSPYVVYQKNESLSEVWAGANYAFKWFNIGVATSSNLEPAASIGMKFDNFSLHYNADYTQSTMLEKKALSHQLTIRFLANTSTVNKRLFKR